MTPPRYDVLVVGAGYAGLTAAVALRRAGFTVSVVEAAPTPGAAAGSDVIPTDLLAAADVLGEEFAALATERRLVERGRFLTDGAGCLGITYRDSDLFRSQWVVLRSTFLGSLAAVAARHGVVLQANTRGESLIREGGRIIGLATTAGPMYADLVFLAEGAAAGLAAREGMEQSNDPRYAPRYLLALEAVLELPPGAVEERFGVRAEEGVACDLFLRNFRLDDRDAPLNLRGWIHTHRAGVTFGMWLPLENLRRHGFASPAALFERVRQWPALGRWLEGARQVAMSARIVRGGGIRDMPHLVGDGVAIGGTAAGGDVTFPHPRCAEAAIVGGVILARAAVAIRAEGSGFCREALARHYARPLMHTPPWQSLEFLRRWPGHVRNAATFFGPDSDLFLETAFVWTRPRRWLPGKAFSWLQLLVRSGGWGAWRRLKDDLQALGWALRVRRWAGRPAVGQLLLDGSLNALRDLAGRARPDVPAAGQFQVRYHSAAPEGDGVSPRFVRRWLERMRPVIAAAVAEVVRPVGKPLATRLALALRLLVRQINLLDLVVAGVLAAMTAVLVGLGSLGAALRRRRRVPPRGTRGWHYAAAVHEALDGENLGPARVAGKVASPLIRLLWPRTLPDDPSLDLEGLPRVCPAEVFEPGGVVHAERCVACEACWRASRFVDWAASQPTNLTPSPPTPLPQGERGERTHAPPGQAQGVPQLLDRLEDKLDAYDRVVQCPPANIHRARADHLDLLALYAQRLAAEAAEVLGGMHVAADGEACRRLGRELEVMTTQRTQRTWNGHFSSASVDGHQIRQHHLPRLRQLLDAPASRSCSAGPPFAPAQSRGDARTPGASLLAVDSAVATLIRSLSERGIPAGLSAEEMALRHDLLNALAADLVPADGPPSGDAYRRYARRLADGWEKARSILRVEGDVAGLCQRQVLAGEWEDVQRAVQRLARLATDWSAARDPAAEDAAADAALAEAFARQEAWLLAEHLALLQLHEHLEVHPDAESELALVRVVLDDAGRDLQRLTDTVEERLAPKEYPQRPVVEPGFGPPLASATEYFSGPERSREGDFLIAAVELAQPRLVPEMLSITPSEPPAAVAPVLAAAARIRRLTERAEAISSHPRPHDDRLAFAWRLHELEAAAFLADALAWVVLGRVIHPAAPTGLLENACAELTGRMLLRRTQTLANQITSAEEIATKSLSFSEDAVAARLLAVVAPFCSLDQAPPAPRHLSPEVLRLEAWKADFRRRLATLAPVLSTIAAGTAERFALQAPLAEAAAWLLGADAVLGRLAWLARQRQTEAPDDPAPLPCPGRRAFSLCIQEVRVRLRCMDGSLLALRRGYWPARVRAAMVFSMAGGS
jgi:electron transfer flavoprotein-quinone oxidoreductase